MKFKGCILKELRENRGTTQRELAEYLGLTPKMISFYEKDERTPPSNILIKLADFFNVSTDFLLGRTIVRKRLESNDVVATKLINLFDMLNDDGKQMIMNYVEDLSTLKKYTK